MATKLEKPLRREIAIGERPFVVTLSPEGVKLAGKGRRKGLELTWEDLVSGEAALAAALRASIMGDARLEPSKRNAANARSPSRGAATGRKRGRGKPTD